MSGTAPVQPATIVSGRGTNSREVAQSRKDNITRLFDNHRNAKRNTIFILPAFILKGDAYNWVAINIVRVVAIAIGVFVQGYCWNSHVIASCHLIFALACVALVASVCYLCYLHQFPSGFPSTIKHRFKHNWINTWLLKIGYIFVYIICLFFDFAPFILICLDKSWYWATYTLAALHITRLIFATFMVIFVIALEIDPELLMMIEINRDNWTITLLIISNSITTEEEKFGNLHTCFCNRFRVFGLTRWVWKSVCKVFSCFERASNVNSKGDHSVGGGGNLGLASQAGNENVNNVQKAPSVAGPSGRSENTSTFNIGDNDGPPIGNTSIALLTGNPNQSALHTQPCPEQSVNPGPDSQIISTVASSNNDIELTNLCAVNLTDLNEDAVVNTNQDLEYSATNNPI